MYYFRVIIGLLLKEIQTLQLICSESENLLMSGNWVRNCDFFPSKTANIHLLVTTYWSRRGPTKTLTGSRHVSLLVHQDLFTITTDTCHSEIPVCNSDLAVCCENSVFFASDS